MKKGTDKTDLFPGILRGDGDVVKCKCTVALETRLTPGSSGNAILTSLRIDSAEQSPPDGLYRLSGQKGLRGEKSVDWDSIRTMTGLADAGQPFVSWRSTSDNTN